MSTIISLDVGKDGIAELRWDDPNAKVNVFSPAAISEFTDCVARIVSDDSIHGVMITSSKKTFHAGADLKMVRSFFDATAEELWEIMSGVMRCFYSLETCGKPVAAAIGGHCLGGGFEMALAAHARFISDDPNIKIGLPEAGLGLMPGFGGTQRMTRTGSWQQVTKDILTGTTYDPETAVGLGLVNQVVPQTSLLQVTREWLLENVGVVQPWMKPGFEISGGASEIDRFFSGMNAGLLGDSDNVGPEKILIAEAIYHGLKMPIEPALKLEIRRFIELLGNSSVRATLEQRFFGKLV